MKRLTLLLAAAIVALASCTKEKHPVTFTIGGYDLGLFPTKGMSEAISTTLPQSIELTLTHKTTGKSYSVLTGEEINLPLGAYHVEGCNSPAATKNIYGIMLTLTHEPKIIVSEDVNVVEGEKSYTLTAAYGSAALVTLASETSSWKGMFGNAEAEIPTLSYGDYRWTFITGDFTSHPFPTTLTPANGGAVRTITIVGSKESLGSVSNGLVAYPGRWYVLHPSDDETQSGGFSLNFPEWALGN